MKQKKFFFKKIGLKAGLEVHQQLDTGKLFCRCPTELSEEAENFFFERRLRPSASETGEFDLAALKEFEKKKVYNYKMNFLNSCLVEMDEEPVHKANSKAITTALQIALMLKATIFPEIFTMRKIVIDGSNTSGFQRTMLLAEHGKIKLKNKVVGIQSIVLEEDACRPETKTSKKTVYLLDRLGFPLIEIATNAELNTLEEVRECALKLGEIVRITCKAKRGLGTIRQDVNVSIKDGARTEIKGVQDIELISRVVEREVERQLNLLKLSKELKKRFKTEKPEKFVARNISKEFEKTNSKIILKELKKGKQVFGFKLKKFSGLLGFELQPERRFATELAELLKVHYSVPGLFHSDELPAYGITEQETKKVKQKLETGKNDAFVLVVCKEKKINKIVSTLHERCLQAIKGVPEETRQALANGNSSYLRPLPGAARMYPETDAPSIKITKKLIEKTKKNLPKTFKERKKLYQKWGLNKKLAVEIAKSNNAINFEELKKQGFNALLLARLYTQEFKKTGVSEKFFTKNRVKQIAELITKGKLHKEVLTETLLEWKKNPANNLEKIILQKTGKQANQTEIKKTIQEIIQKNTILIKKQGLRAIGPLMGDAMKKLKGKISGKKLSEMLKKEIKKIIE